MTARKLTFSLSRASLWSPTPIFGEAAREKKNFVIIYHSNYLLLRPPDEKKDDLYRRSKFFAPTLDFFLTDI